MTETQALEIAKRITEAVLEVPALLSIHAVNITENRLSLTGRVSILDSNRSCFLGIPFTFFAYNLKVALDIHDCFINFAESLRASFTDVLAPMRYTLCTTRNALCIASEIVKIQDYRVFQDLPDYCPELSICCTSSDQQLELGQRFTLTSIFSNDKLNSLCAEASQIVHSQMTVTAT